MISYLLQTEPDYIFSFLRIIAGIIIFPYGMQKLLGWFQPLGGGIGTKDTLQQLGKKKIPAVIGWLVIIGQSFGSIALLIGLLGRVAAAGNFIIITGALLTHAAAGWHMNWDGKKKGEGMEYFILLLSILLAVIIKGSGAFSVDRWLLQKF